ncbi:MAG: DNA polymerase I [Planctomycetia bacterium]
MNETFAAPAASAAEPDLQGRTVWAIDTLSRIYQLFHALPEMAAPDGTPVSAVFGFTRDLLDIIDNRRPGYLFCAIDAPGPTFRHEKFAAYKANRPDMPADLVPQIPLIRRLLDVMGIPCLERAGFEADDLLATLATRTVARGGDCIIATSDKDARQLLGDHVRLYNLRTNLPFGAAELRAEWGIAPGQVVDFLSLVGDAVDNVPGVPGIGPKIAGELLQQHGTLDAILAHIDSVSGTKRRENLTAHADTARAGRELIRLDTGVLLDIPWQAGLLHQPDATRLADFLRELGFRSLLAKVKGAAGSSPRQAAGEAGVAAATKPAPAKPRRAPGTLFDLDGDDEPAPGTSLDAAAAPAGELVIATDEPQIAAAIARLRAAPPVVVCVARDPAGSSMAPPLGIALAADGLTLWADASRLAASPGLRDLLADAAVPKQGHDLKAQEVAIRAAGLQLGGAGFDTMLAAYLLEAGERNLGLVETAVRHDVLSADDAAIAAPAGLDRPTDPADAARHCAVVRELADLLPARLAAAGLEPLYRDVELPLAGVLADMECRGVRIDAAALAALSADYAVRLAELEREVQALAGRPFSLASPVQVRAVLFTDLGLPVVKRTKTGPSTDADVLEELAPLHPLPAKLLEHRKFAKLKSTYVDALPALVNATTGRIHTSFNQTVTATGRLSSSDPNRQNIPIRTAEGQQIRAAFLPGVAGWRFVAADYSQVELRILAHLSGDEVMKSAFAAGEDIHARTAAAVFHVAPADVTSAMRRTAKAVNFGILYGQSGFGLAKALGIPQEEATEFIAAYFRTFAGAAAFMDDVLDRCRRDGHVTTILGRRRAIVGVRDRDRRRAAAGGFALTLPERTAVNTVVQGSAADLIKLAMLRVHRRLAAAGLQAALVLQIHDELLLECPPVEVAAATAILVEEMRGALVFSVPLDVSAHAGDTWAECHA